jgi:hypothetical protein
LTKIPAVFLLTTVRTRKRVPTYVEALGPYGSEGFTRFPKGGGVNLDARLTAQLAALAVGVSKQTFNYWRASGKISAGDDGCYRYGDVLAAEAATRRSPKSHRSIRLPLAS